MFYTFTQRLLAGNRPYFYLMSVGTPKLSYVNLGFFNGGKKVQIGIISSSERTHFDLETGNKRDFRFVIMFVVISVEESVLLARR